MIPAAVVKGAWYNTPPHPTPAGPGVTLVLRKSWHENFISSPSPNSLVSPSDCILKRAPQKSFRVFKKVQKKLSWIAGHTSALTNNTGEDKFSSTWLFLCFSERMSAFSSYSSLSSFPTFPIDKDTKKLQPIPPLIQPRNGNVNEEEMMMLQRFRLPFPLSLLLFSLRRRSLVLCALLATIKRTATLSLPSFSLTPRDATRCSSSPLFSTATDAVFTRKIDYNKAVKRFGCGDF